MPRLTIFTPEEIQAFDKPPKFTTEQRQKYFELTHSAQSLLQTLRTPTNKVCLLMHWGYFRATGRFFLPKDFRRADMDYVADLLSIGPSLIDLNDYCEKPKISRDHEKLVMKAMQFKPFDQTDKALLYERIQRLAEKHMQPREILYFLASQLHQQKTEIPGYYTFSEAISKIYNQVEAKLLSVIETSITSTQKTAFLKLTEINNEDGNELKLSTWKSINHECVAMLVRRRRSLPVPTPRA